MGKPLDAMGDDEEKAFTNGKKASSGGKKMKRGDRKSGSLLGHRMGT